MCTMEFERAGGYLRGYVYENVGKMDVCNLYGWWCLDASFAWRISFPCTLATWLQVRQRLQSVCVFLCLSLARVKCYYWRTSNNSHYFLG